MEPRSWLFPMMVVAAGSVMVFGCIGIAAITGHLPAHPSGTLLAVPSEQTVQITAAELASESVPPATPAPAAEEAVKAIEEASKTAAARKKALDRTVN